MEETRHVWWPMFFARDFTKKEGGSHGLASRNGGLVGFIGDFMGIWWGFHGDFGISWWFRGIHPQFNSSIYSMAMTQDPIHWRYLPYIRPKFQGISPENMARNMVLTYLHFRILKISHWFMRLMIGLTTSVTAAPGAGDLSSSPLVDLWGISSIYVQSFKHRFQHIEISSRQITTFFWLSFKIIQSVSTYLYTTLQYTTTINFWIGAQ